MRLTDLDPKFIRYESRVEAYEVVEGDYATWRERGSPTREVTGPREYKVFVGSLAEAQGVTFLCPKCYAAAVDGVGVHSCEVTFKGRGVPNEMGTHNKAGKAVRWDVSGAGAYDLTISPSILLESADGCGWHGFVTNGEAR